MITLTPELLAAAYRLLHVSKPFMDWNLPDADDVRFKVVNSRYYFARFVRYGKDDPFVIEVSRNCVGTLATLLPFMGHEMVHMHLDELGYDRKGVETLHSARFRVLAAQVCKVHKWDYKAFF